MKIRPSLRIYFIAVSLLMVFIITLAYSAFALSYFSDGVDVGSIPVMEKISKVEGVSDGNPVEVLGFFVSSRWQDLPQQIKATFENDEPDDSAHFVKSIIGGGPFSPPTGVYIAARFVNKGDQVRYVAAMHTPPENRDNGRPAVPIVYIGLMILLSLALFIGGLLLLIRKIAAPIESLKNWAKGLDETSVEKPTPDFSYSELNTLAGVVRSSLSATHEVLGREKKFQAHASHELRTPISVVRTNTQLLVKLQEKEGASLKQKEVVQRIERAAKTMTSLTDTLLWLSRDNENLPMPKPVQMSALVEDLVAELGYLLSNKPVKLTLVTAPCTMDVAEIPCRIVLANLIRNAFQHTMDGTVMVNQKGNQVTIENTSKNDTMDSANLGFGLGLRLTRELAERYHWCYSDNVRENCYRASIRFGESTD